MEPSLGSLTSLMALVDSFKGMSSNDDVNAQYETVPSRSENDCRTSVRQGYRDSLNQSPKDDVNLDWDDDDIQLKPIKNSGQRQQEVAPVSDERLVRPYLHFNSV